MKKRYLIIAMLLFSSFLFACAKGKVIDPANKMPTMEELQTYYNTHTEAEYNEVLKRIKTVLDQTDFAKLCDIYETSLVNWKDSQEILEIEKMDVEFSKDDLLMEQTKNEKRYNNISVQVKIYYQNEFDNKKKSSVKNQVYDEIMGILRSTPYGHYKISSIDIDFNNVARDPNSLGEGKKSNFFINSDVLVVDQNLDEYHVQTYVYDKIKELNLKYFNHEVYGKYGNIFLDRFGVESGSDQLEIDISIPSTPLDYQPSDSALYIEEMGSDLYESIMADDQSEEYLRKMEVKFVIIRIQALWDANADDANGYHIFQFGIGF